MIALLLAAALQTVAAPPPPGEEAVAPYAQSDANAGAKPFAGTRIWRAFHEKAGVDRIVDEMVARNVADPRIADIFKGQDLVRIRRTLKEQFCYILGGGCTYTGRDMKSAHAGMGVTGPEFDALVGDLVATLSKFKVGEREKNELLGALGPMKKDIVEKPTAMLPSEDNRSAHQAAIWANQDERASLAV